MFPSCDHQRQRPGSSENRRESCMRSGSNPVSMYPCHATPDPPLSFINKKNMVVRNQLSPPRCLVTPLYPFFPRSVTRFFARLSTVSRALSQSACPVDSWTFVQSNRIIMCEHVGFLERIEIHTCALLLTLLDDV